MSTFLQLCQDVRREAGISGTGPSAVTAQTGMYERIVGWVQEAYGEILRMHAWTFLRTRGTGTTIAAQDVYTGTQLGLSDMGRVYVRKMFDTTETTPRRIYFRNWDSMDEAPASSGRPDYFTRQPDGTLLLYPTPDGAYTLQIDYLREGSTLAANGDTPIIPDAQLHKIIVYKALTYYALHDENPAALQHGAMMFNNMLGQMYSKYGSALLTAAVPLDQVASPDTMELV